MSFVKSIFNHRNCNYCHHRNQTIKFRSLHSHCHLKIINAASVNMSDDLKILCSSNYAFDKITAYNGGRDGETANNAPFTLYQKAEMNDLGYRFGKAATETVNLVPSLSLKCHIRHSY